VRRSAADGMFDFTMLFDDDNVRKVISKLSLRHLDIPTDGYRNFTERIGIAAFGCTVLHKLWQATCHLPRHYILQTQIGQNV